LVGRGKFGALDLFEFGERFDAMLMTFFNRRKTCVIPTVVIEPVCNFFIKQFSVISSGLHKF